jgi:hypothetical protein
MTYDIGIEPQGADYVGLLRFLAPIASQFLLVKRPTMPLNDGGQKALEALRAYIISKGDAERWPGTQLLHGHQATVYRFSTTKQAIDILCDTTSRLFAWQQPELPEDLCFEKDDNTPLLSCICHENEARLYLSTADFHRFEQRLPLITLRPVVALRQKLQ